MCAAGSTPCRSVSPTRTLTRRSATALRETLLSPSPAGRGACSRLRVFKYTRPEMNDDDARRCLQTLRQQRDNPVALDHGRLIGSGANQVGNVGWHVAPRPSRSRVTARVHPCIHYVSSPCYTNTSSSISKYAIVSCTQHTASSPPPTSAEPTFPPAAAPVPNRGHQRDFRPRWEGPPGSRDGTGQDCHGTATSPPARSTLRTNPRACARTPRSLPRPRLRQTPPRRPLAAPVP